MKKKLTTTVKVGILLENVIWRYATWLCDNTSVLGVSANKMNHYEESTWKVMSCKLRHYATSWKVAGLRHDEAIEFFQFT
jgi:hypothetical protein